jgi:hypothetical protein
MMSSRKAEEGRILGESGYVAYYRGVSTYLWVVHMRPVKIMRLSNQNGFLDPAVRPHQ